MANEDRPVTFSIGMILLLTSMAAVSAAVMRNAPGLGLAVLFLLTPTLLRTLRVQRLRPSYRMVADYMAVFCDSLFYVIAFHLSVTIVWCLLALIGASTLGIDIEDQGLLLFGIILDLPAIVWSLGLVRLPVLLESPEWLRPEPRVARKDKARESEV